MVQPQKATQQQTKAYNSQLVLKTIYDRGQISRAEIARLTNLTRTTVSELVTELQDRGLVEEIGLGPSIGGRSPILLSMVDDARHVIGIDLANDEFSGAVFNLRNEIVHTARVPVAGENGEAALAGVYTLIDHLIGGTHQPLLGIGIGTPGLVDTPNGVVLRAVNLAWRNLPLERLLEERYHLPVYVVNDSQLAAMAHFMFGQGQPPANVIVIMAGHGVGAGMVLNGQLFQGDGGGAGEIGHVAVVEGGRLCRCGNHGCLETVVSVGSIAARAAVVARAQPASRLHALAGDPQKLTIGVVRQAAEAGDAAALAVVEETARYLSIAVANLVGVLNVQRIIVAGALAGLGPLLQQHTQREMRRRALPALAQNTHVELAAQDSNIVVRGAAALLLARELGLSPTR
jgi:N-acetylglucosamine repressor